MVPAQQCAALRMGRRDELTALEESLIHHPSVIQAHDDIAGAYDDAVKKAAGEPAGTRTSERGSWVSLVSTLVLGAFLLLGAVLCGMRVIDRMTFVEEEEEEQSLARSSSVAALRNGYTPKSKEPSEAELWPREDSPWNASALQSLRTAFHFQAPKNWMNDPDAPLYYKGWYHLFYQYNPSEAYWGLISWGHTVSRDLIHWLYVEPLAMVPDHWYDENGVWTGSATMLPTTRDEAERVGGGAGAEEQQQEFIPGIMYTGSTNESVQVQNLVFPSDPADELLVEWRKVAGNPVLTPPAFINATDFRDPTTAWRDTARPGPWTLAIGSHLRPTHTGVALLYQSADFLTWELVPGKFLHMAQGTGMWECVDFYPVAASGERRGLDTSAAGAGVKHVLKASLDDSKLDFYTIGEYDAEGLRFTPDDADLELGSGYRYDDGRYYASKTFFDPVSQRRILFGWVNESDTRDDDVVKGWSGVQSIPRQVWLDSFTNNSLIQWPIEEIKSLYKSNVSFTSFILESGTIFKIEEAQGAQWDMSVTFTKPSSAYRIKEAHIDDASKIVTSTMGCNQNEIMKNHTIGPFGVSVLSSEDLQEQTRVYFYLFPTQGHNNKTSHVSWRTLVCNDLSRSSLASHVDNGTYGGLVTVLEDEDELTLRILVDRSIIETFAQGGRTVITSRVYPTIALDTSAKLYLFNDGETSIEVRNFEAYELSSINIHYISR